MSNRAFYYTLIKRSHLVLRSGPGAVIRSRQGLTAVVGGLHEWQRQVPGSAGGGAEARQYVLQHSFTEPELTAATGIKRFLPPPAFDDARDARSWTVPFFRFPLTGMCSNFQCRRLVSANPGDRFRRRWDCPHCQGKIKGKVQQLPFFLACPLGHIDEVDWDAAIDHEDGCAGGEISLNLLAGGEGAIAKCRVCDKTGRSESVRCTGARPWVPRLDSDSCDEMMEVVSRASVKVYYPNTLTAIHIPVDAELDENLLGWLERTKWAVGRRLDTPEERADVVEALRGVGWNVDEDSAVAHIRHALAPPPDEDWSILTARRREFEVLSGQRTYPALSTSPLISLDPTDVEVYDHPMIGPDRLITGITAVHKLTESRTVNGFSRIAPRSVTPRDGRVLMWGADTDDDAWLPGYRAHGEGIFLTINPAAFSEFGAQEDPTKRSLLLLSEAGIAVHTLAHLLIGQLAERAGYSTPSLRDRVYDLSDGSIGVLVYTAEGDSLGTLGGLVAFAQPGDFEALLSAAINSARWCPQDPVCEETTLDTQRGIHAACHQCVLLPETSCELFNSWLDRRAVQALEPEARS